MNMSHQWIFFKQRYYRNFNTLRLCRAGLLSGNVQCEPIAAREKIQTKILTDP